MISRDLLDAVVNPPSGVHQLKVVDDPQAWVPDSPSLAFISER